MASDDNAVSPTNSVGEESLTNHALPVVELKWPAGDRDSPTLGEFTGNFSPSSQFGLLLQMEGFNGRLDDEVKRQTGSSLDRARRWHKIFERMGIFYPGGEVTRLGRLGRLLKDASHPNGLERVVAREAAGLLMRYQLDNPIEKAAPAGCDVHPYYVILAAASRLGWRIHWDEVNRELMRLTSDSQLDAAIARIAEARKDPKYASFIGRSFNGEGLLSARAHYADARAPEGKTPEGQLRDQKLTPWLKRAGFGELLLEAGGASGGGYWTVPERARDIVQQAIATPPEYKRFSSAEGWVEWFCEGIVTLNQKLEELPSPPPTVNLPIADLSLSALKAAIQKYDPELEYSDALLASVVAALRAGDGRNFLILRGVSGTGKTRLVAAIAKAIYGSAQVPAPYLTIVEVRPDWTDGSYLLGHYDPIAQTYVRPRFLDALVAADAAAAGGNPAPPVLICLDEMNLARVEYYLSDCLSAMESGNSMSLETRGDPHVPQQLRWPPNVYLFGTINIDESTMRISDKVLDRAQVIDTSDISIQPALQRWLDQCAALDAGECARATVIIAGVWKILSEAGVPFGFRTARAMVRFVDEAKGSSGGALAIDDALDAQLNQKVLVKLRGEGDRWRKPLSELSNLLSGLDGAKRSHKALLRMQTDLDRLGSFEFWN